MNQTGTIYLRTMKKKSKIILLLLGLSWQVLLAQTD